MTKDLTTINIFLYFNLSLKAHKYLTRIKKKFKITKIYTSFLNYILYILKIRNISKYFIFKRFGMAFPP